MGSFKEITEQLKKGELVILLDDVETYSGYLIGLAENVSGHQINLVTKIGKGLVCVGINHEKAKQLQLPLMNGENNPKKNFTLSIDHHTNTTGISAFDRANTIKAVTNEETIPEDFKRPGHIFPLVSSENGVLDYLGIVEASTDLAKMCSGSSGFTYLCEILNKQGNMATLEEIAEISKEFRIPTIKITEVFKLMQNRSICTFDAQVVHGQKLGRKLGYPTANLDLSTNKDYLRNGVYGVKVNWREQTFLGVMNAGVKPTMNDHMQKSYEIHILDFNDSIYGEAINVEVKFFMREEKKFNSVIQLIQQIEKDIQEVKTKFEWQQGVKVGL